MTTAAPAGSAAEVFRAFLRLGFTSFGGPVAHLGYFRDEFVSRRKWLDEADYADLVALCQFMPGPASSQVGLAIGLGRAGVRGAAAAWTAFTLPSALALALFAWGVVSFGGVLGSGWLAGLKLAAVAVVAQAVWGMGRTLCPDRERASLAAGAALLALVWPTPLGQVAVIVLGGLAGLALPAEPAPETPRHLAGGVGRRTAVGCLVAFFLLLGGLPLLAEAADGGLVAVVDAFYRAGALVFGGGHVVLPLLQSSVVEPGWVSQDAFLAGYGAAQAVPGPLFTFSSYLGWVMQGPASGPVGAAVALLAIFLPSFLLVPGLLPFWDALRSDARMRRALRGINAAVVGLLLAAFYDPVFTAGVTGPLAAGLAVVAFVALHFWKAPPWAVVIAMALIGGLVL